MSREENRLFSHMVYEYKKGIRRLVLYTAKEHEAELCRMKLSKSGIAWYELASKDGRINFFFGDCPCISIIRSFGEKPLNEFNEKEDFILGVLLGYDLTKQCERYLNNTERAFCAVCAAG
ncbi:MAG: DUF2023 family protein [Deferribacterales bacterium]